MDFDPLLILAGILVLGIGAQWLAWRLALPSILLLLAFGIAAGAFGLLAPSELFGEELLSSVISLSVGVILYEGGLTLRVSELSSSGRVVWRLVSIGALVTWLSATAAAYFILGLTFDLALLLGAVLIVTGPTVIQPLLRHVKPTGPVGKILKWEGIVIDPIGALTAVLVFEVVRGDDAHTLSAVVKTLVCGGGLGLAGAAAFVFLLKRFWIPDFLASAVSLAMAVGIFAVSNAVQHESGLFAVTLMGVLIANQHFVEVEEIIEFKENLRVLLISGLFIVLGARLDTSDLVALGWRGALFVLALVVVARPVSVFCSTIGSNLKRSEVLFLSWMAPRGIVAAAVASVFALELESREIPQASMLVSATFAIIIGTVVIYGFTAPILAYRLGLAERNPQGLLIVGADDWHRALAECLAKLDLRILLVDTNREHTRRARMLGLETFTGSALDEHMLDEIELGGLGRLIAATPNDFVNLVATQRIGRAFGKANAYQLAPTANPSDAQERIGARVLFAEDLTYDEIAHRVEDGATFKATPLTEAFGYDAYREQYGDAAQELFVLEPDGDLRIVTASSAAQPKAGETLISLTRE